MSTSARQEWRRGWHLVLLTALGIACAPTALPVYSLGVFVEPFQAEFGWGRGEIQTVILFSTGLSIFCAPLSGTMVKRFGLRWTILPGLAGVGIGLLAAAANTGSLWQLYAAYALMSVLGTGAGMIGWGALISGRFDKARGLALGLALSGTGLCAALMPQIALAGMSVLGWRGAYLFLAGFVLLIALPICMAVLPDDPVADNKTEQPVHVTGMDASAALRHWRFWVLGVATGAIYMVVGGLLPNFVPLLQDNGLSAAAAASIMGMFGISVVVGRICVGALVDRFWAPAVATAVLIPAAIACLVLQGETSLVVAAASVMIIGAATGMELDVLSFLTARYFGIADYARIYGRLFVFLAFTAGVAPMLFGYFHDWTGHYALPLQISAGLLVAGAVLLLALGRYPQEYARNE
jgi:MFS family permease